jgi:hypothetical protein
MRRLVFAIAALLAVPLAAPVGASAGIVSQPAAVSTEASPVQQAAYYRHHRHWHHRHHRHHWHRHY